MLKIMLKSVRFLFFFTHTIVLLIIKRCVFLKKGHFPLGKMGYNLTIPNIRLIFAGLTE